MGRIVSGSMARTLSCALCSIALLFGLAPMVPTTAYADDDAGSGYRLLSHEELLASPAASGGKSDGQGPALELRSANVVSTAKTAIDFFASRGSDAAVSAIEDCKYSSYTNIGSSKDATDLRNMYASLQWLSVYNQRYRVSLGLPELRVNDLYMAYAIADANYSDKHIAHAQQFYCGENLAWNWGTDPYLQWYDQEKALYDAGNRDMSDVGHYLNIIQPDYRVTGFAINRNGSLYGMTYSQVFGYEGTRTQTVSDYFADFKEYYDEHASLEMHRLYNPNSGEHFYTSSTDEANSLSRAGWKYEGVAWLAPISSNTPVYRMYNANAGDHHYTTNLEERNMLVKAGWRDEGIGWYSMEGNGERLHRLYNPNAIAGSHHYTMDSKEKDMLVGHGWVYEGTCWAGLRP